MKITISSNLFFLVAFFGMAGPACGQFAENDAYLPIWQHMESQIENISVNMTMYGSDIGEDSPWKISAVFDYQSGRWAGTRLSNSDDAQTGDSVVNEQGWGLFSAGSWKAVGLSGETRNVTIEAAVERPHEDSYRASVGYEVIGLVVTPYHKYILEHSPEAKFILKEEEDIGGEVPKKRLVYEIEGVQTPSPEQPLLLEYVLGSIDGEHVLHSTVAKLGGDTFFELNLSDFEAASGVMFPKNIDYKESYPGGTAAKSDGWHNVIVVEEVIANRFLEDKNFFPPLREGDFVDDQIAGVEYFYRAAVASPLLGNASSVISTFSGESLVGEVGEERGPDGVLTGVESSLNEVSSPHEKNQPGDAAMGKAHSLWKLGIIILAVVSCAVAFKYLRRG